MTKRRRSESCILNLHAAQGTSPKQFTSTVHFRHYNNGLKRNSRQKQVSSRNRRSSNVESKFQVVIGPFSNYKTNTGLAVLLVTDLVCTLRTHHNTMFSVPPKRFNRNQHWPISAMFSQQTSNMIIVEAMHVLIVHSSLLDPGYCK